MKVYKIFFSPTDTTQKIVSAISQVWEKDDKVTVDLTKPENRKSFQTVFNNDDIIIIGVPVYEERIPEIAEESIKKLKGQGQLVILVVLYGNIGEGIALKQLSSIVIRAGFNIVGAASFIGEHSYSNRQLEIAKNRPDKADLEQARCFGEKVLRKINNFKEFKEINESQIDGKLPLIAKVLPRNSAKKFAKRPDVIQERCNECGICISVCPNKAINKNFVVDDDLCLRCFACVKKCPIKAREINYKNKLLVKTFLKLKGSKRKEPKIYI